MKPERIQTPIADLPLWQYQQFEFLGRRFEFRDYAEVLDFLIALCEFTRSSGYQPSIEVRHTKVELRVPVPEGGLNEELAEYVRSVEALPELRPNMPKRSSANSASGAA